MTAARLAELRAILPKVEDADFWPCDRAELSYLIAAAERVTIMTAARLAELRDTARTWRDVSVPSAEMLALLAAAEENARLRAEVDRFSSKCEALLTSWREIEVRAQQRIADLERKLAERQWRTMETAPRDGTLILVLLDTGDVAKADFDHGVWWGVSNRKPTLWMPLPDVPGTEPDTKQQGES